MYYPLLVPRDGGCRDSSKNPVVESSRMAVCGHATASKFSDIREGHEG